MTTQEFSIEFDILYNNLASNAAPPLNEYEKSVFLTKAQSDIVLELYSGRNNLGLAFESSEEVREYLKPLITTKSIELRYVSESTEYWNLKGLVRYELIDTSASSVVDYTKDIMFRLKEEILEEEDFSDSTKYYKTYPVIPISLDELESVINNPFKGPKFGKRALRIDSKLPESTSGISNNITILMSNKTPTTSTLLYSYRIWYLRYPKPIVIKVGQANISEANGITIENVNITQETQCELPSSLHRMILERAVLYAKQAYIGGQTQA